MVNFFKQHKEGLLLTLLFHIGLVLALFWFKFITPLPLPEEKGIQVDFGTSETGSGAVEPPRQSTPKPVPQIVDRRTSEETTQPPLPQKSQPSVPQPATPREQVMTQDYEEAAAVEAARLKAKTEQQKKDLEQKRLRDQQLAQQEVDRQNRLAREKQIADSLKQIENARLAEQRRIAEARRRDSIRKADEEAKAAAIDSKAKNAFGPATGGNSQSTSTGQGVGYKPGNQGSVTGTPGAGQYGPGGGDGISFSLTGRKMRSMVKPLYSENEEGTVVVTITVDINGNVTNAVAGARGTTSMNQSLWQAAVKAARATKFDANSNAPAQQTGTITYRFVLN